MPIALITPVSTLNGTDAEHLQDAILNARAAVMGVSRAVDDASPNGRDYYPQGPNAYTAAVAEFNLVGNVLSGLAGDLLWVADPGEREVAPARVVGGGIGTNAAVPAKPGYFPTIHSNGTSRGALKDAVKRVVEAANKATAALSQIVPNGRDYASPEDLEGARNQHYARVAAVQQVADYYVAQIALSLGEPSIATPAPSLPVTQESAHEAARGYVRRLLADGYDSARAAQEGELGVVLPGELGYIVQNGRIIVPVIGKPKFEFPFAALEAEVRKAQSADQQSAKAPSDASVIPPGIGPQISDTHTPEAAVSAAESQPTVTPTPMSTEPLKWTSGAGLGPRMAKEFNEALKGAKMASQCYREKRGVRGVSEVIDSGCMWQMIGGGPGTNELYEPGMAKIRADHGTAVTPANRHAIIAALKELTKAMSANPMIVDATISPEEDAKRKAALAKSRAASEALDRASRETKDALSRITPSWAKALIVAQSVEDESDSQTDYFSHKTSRTVLIGFRSGDREDFRQLRAAAGRFPETAHLANAKADDVEHRENYSMGGGNYLKDGGRHSTGWQVKSISVGGPTYGGLEIADHIVNPRMNEATAPEPTVSRNEAVFQHRPPQAVIDDLSTIANVWAPALKEDPSAKVAATGGAAVRENLEKGGVEIRFAAKPDQAVIDSLKTQKFRWSQFSNCWWIKKTPQALTFAQELVAKVNGVAPAAQEAAQTQAAAAPAEAGQSQPRDKGPAYEATSQPGLLYWAQRNPTLRDSKVESWCVVAQAAGFPASEAHDDWFANFKDADEVAQQLAKAVGQDQAPATEAPETNPFATEAAKCRNAILLAADSPEKLRPCDVGRVFDAATDMGVLDAVKVSLLENNKPAYEAMLQYERELQQEAHAVPPAPAQAETAAPVPTPPAPDPKSTIAAFFEQAVAGMLPAADDPAWDEIPVAAILACRNEAGDTLAYVAAGSSQLDCLPGRLLSPEVMSQQSSTGLNDSAFHWAAACGQVAAMLPENITPELVAVRNKLGQTALDLADSAALAELPAQHQAAIAAARAGRKYESPAQTQGQPVSSGRGR